MEIQVSKGLFTRRRTGPPRRGRIEEQLSNAEQQLCNSATYKREPSISAVPEIIRPISRACKTCVQNSQAVIHHEYLLKGTRNSFNPEASNKKNPFYVKAMPSLFRFWRMTKLSRENLLVKPEEVFEAASAALLQTVFHKKFEDGAQLNLYKILRIPKEVVLKFLSSFGARPLTDQVFNVFIRFGGWIIGKIFSAIFGVITVHRGELDLVKIAVQTGLPAIFVPLHRSHLDPFIISWTLLEAGLCPPLFVASHTLMKTPILRYGAKFFGGIGQSGLRDQEGMGYQSPGISAAVFIYFSLLLKKGNNILLPVEPHRSRSGKPSSSLLGSEFFNVLLNLYRAKEIEDAFIIPVSVNYDILPEEQMLEDYQVAPTSTGMTASHSVRFLWNCFQKPRGVVRVGFSQPFRLREFKASNLQSNEITNAGWNIPTTMFPCNSIPGAEVQWYEENGSIASLSSVYGETDFLDLLDSSSHPAVDSLLHHSLYDAANGSIIMSTQIVAFLLLNNRAGMFYNMLLNEMKLLTHEIRDTYKRDVGFCGKIEDAMKNAISLLGRSLVSVEDLKGAFFVKPVMDKCSLVKLHYYSSHVSSLFGMEGAIATALFSMLHPTVSANKGDGFVHSVTQIELQNRATQVCELLKTEFLLHAPCVTTSAAVADGLERFKDVGLLRFEMKKVYNEAEFDTEIGTMPDMINIVQRIDVMLSTEALRKLEFYRCIVIPYLEVYAKASRSLHVLIAPRDSGFIGVEDMELRRNIYTEAAEQRCLNPEMVTHDTVRNFLSAMGNIGVIRSYANDETEFKKMFYMSPEYNSTSNLEQFTEAILKYCTSDE